MNDKWNKKELEIMYYEKSLTLEDIGQIKGCTREYVRQVMESFDLKRIKNRKHKRR